MPASTLSSLALALGAAEDIESSLLALHAYVDENVRGAQLTYLRYDAHRLVVRERMVVGEKGVQTSPLEVSLDHLPPRYRRDVVNGTGLVDFGEQSADFIRFLEAGDPAEAFLLLQGIVLDGELFAVLAIREPKQRFGARPTERLAPPAALFALAARKAGERVARAEADRALRELMERVHSEYGRTIGALHAELEDTRHRLVTATADARVAELERSAQAAADEARTALERLSAVEQQVTAAVGQLEKAHLDLSRQSDALLNQSNLLYRIERLLTESAQAGGGDPRKVLDEVRAAVAARH